MTSLKVLDEKPKELPEEACLELLQYVDFLLYKYAGEQASDEGYDKLLKELITERYQKYQSDRDSASSSKDFAQRTRQR